MTFMCSRCMICIFQLPRQALGIRRLERTNFTDNAKPRSSTSQQLIPSEPTRADPCLGSKTAAQTTPQTQARARTHKVAPPEKPPRRTVVPELAARCQHEAQGVSSVVIHQGLLNGGVHQQQAATNTTLSSSLAEFEREYAEMCKKPEEMCITGTLQDWSSAMAIKSSSAAISRTETASTLSSPMSDSSSCDRNYLDGVSHCQLGSPSPSEALVLDTRCANANGDVSQTDSPTSSRQAQDTEHQSCISAHSERDDTEEAGTTTHQLSWTREEEDEDEDDSDSELSTDSGPMFLTAEVS